jgi:hypothetical protein
VFRIGYYNLVGIENRVKVIVTRWAVKMATWAATPVGDYPYRWLKILTDDLNKEHLVFVAFRFLNTRSLGDLM